MGYNIEAQLRFKKYKQDNDRARSPVSDKMSRFRGGSTSSVAFNDNDQRDQDAAE